MLQSGPIFLARYSHWLLPKYNLNWLKIEQSQANPVALATLLTANFTSTPEGVKGNLLIINTLRRWKEMTVHQKVFSNITIVAPTCKHPTLPSLPGQDPWEQLQGKTWKYKRGPCEWGARLPQGKLSRFVSPLNFVVTKKILTDHPNGTGRS